MRTTAQRARTQAREVADLLARTYPDAKCALNYRNAFELLVATVLSAQTTDQRVNTVTPELFDTYPTPRDLARGRAEDVAQIVRPLGFHRRRSTQLVGLAAALVEDHGGTVPATRSELQALPGVGRKTAHVVLGNAFGHSAITVDTHVGRLARRLGWSTAERPLAVERDLESLLPDVDWTLLCHRLIAHGRAVCHSRSPECGHCVLASLCPSACEEESTRGGARRGASRGARQ